jgi:ACS family hexuronate transporter-like MFS transporter
MSLAIPDVQVPARANNWRWWVCGLLLLATMINYMDRLVLNQTATRLMSDLGFDEAGYGQLEGYFGAAFAIGALLLGFVVDRLGPRLVYPLVVLLWSLAGFVTGFVQTFEQLLACRIALGFFEAANWSCALKTTQHILRPEERAGGNGILQSGAAFGAIITPQLVMGFLYLELYNGWRPAFWFVGGLGMIWVVLWLTLVRSSDLAMTRTASHSGETNWLPVLADRRFWVLAFTVVAINLTWHFFRAWMPLFLERKHGYTNWQVQLFTTAYYIATDAGSLVAGFLAVRLARKGMAVHHSRLLVFAGCALLTLLSIPVAFLDRGPLLLALLLVLGFAALGLFPNYYSFSQELTSRHQGKVTGILGFTCWMAMYPMQINVGAYVKATQSYTEAVALAGLPPLAALLVLGLFWGRREAPRPVSEPAPGTNGVPAPVASAAAVTEPSYTTRPA